MKDRILLFLQSEQLTPAKFADLLGVQRSGVSHILSGRNNPGLDFIVKLLTRFPTVNAEWLITGKGNIYKELYSPAPIPDLFNTLPVSPSSPIQEPPEIPELPEHPRLPEAPPKQGQKQVSKIVIFYTDRTFGEYLPE